MTYAIVEEALRRYLPQSHPSYPVLSSLLASAKARCRRLALALLTVRLTLLVTQGAEEDTAWLAAEIAREQSVEQARTEKLEKSRQEEEDARKKLDAALARAKEAKEGKEGDEARDEADREKEKFDKESRARKNERERQEEKRVHEALVKQHLVDGHLPEVEAYLFLLVILFVTDKGTREKVHGGPTTRTGTHTHACMRTSQPLRSLSGPLRARAQFPRFCMRAESSAERRAGCGGCERGGGSPACLQPAHTGLCDGAHLQLLLPRARGGRPPQGDPHVRLPARAWAGGRRVLIVLAPRRKLLDMHQTACLRHDEPGQVCIFGALGCHCFADCRVNVACVCACRRR